MSTPFQIQEHNRDFHLKEYDSLRKEIEFSIQEARTIERQALIATALVWTWLVTHTDVNLPAISWWVPMFFAILGGAKCYRLLKGVNRAAVYILKLETILTTDELGWEHFLFEYKAQSIPCPLRAIKWPALQREMRFISWPALFFWSVLLAATILFPIVARKH